MVQASRCPLPMESFRTCLIPRSHIVTTCVITVTTREAYLRLSAWGFYLGCGHVGHPLLSMYQDSRLLERKWVFQINCIVCTNCLDTMTLLSRRMVRIPQKCKSPLPAIKQLCKQDFQRVTVSSAMLTLFTSST